MSVNQRRQTAPIGTAVVGVGRFGRVHARRYLGLPASRLLALVDPRPETAELASDLGVPWLSHIDHIPPAVQAVSVVTPMASHYPIAKSLLLRGIDVLVEKPMT